MIVRCTNNLIGGCFTKGRNYEVINKQYNEFMILHNDVNGVVKLPWDMYRSNFRIVRI